MEGLKNQQQRIIGLDIHPECFSAACLQPKSFSDTDPQVLWVHNRIDMDDLESWVKKNTIETDLFILEAGCNSFETVARIESCKRKSVVLESFRAGKIGKSYLKSDKVDAVKTGKIYLSGIATEVGVPDEKTREYREIYAAYKKSVKDTTRIRNRIWSFCTEHGLKRKSGISFLDGTGKAWIVSQRKWTATQLVFIDMLISDLKHFHVNRKSLRKLMSSIVSENKDMLKLLRLYGINKITAFALIATIGDITRFRKPKKLVAYIGLQPKVYNSGKVSYHGGVTGFGKRDIKALLIECAQCILRMGSAGNSLAKWGRSLRLRKSGKVAAVAVARKLVVATWYLLRGFFTQLKEPDQTLKTKLRKLATEIGKEKRSDYGYKTAMDFIEDKVKILQAGT
jgi:transposase